MKASLEKTANAGRTTDLCLTAGLAAILLTLAGVADPAEAKKRKDRKVEKIAFSSDRTTGTGVNNPTGDDEIFIMNPDGTELKQLTFNTVSDFQPTLSPDGQKIAFVSSGIQSTNAQGEAEIYLMNADGSGQKNLSNTSGGVFDFDPNFSPDSQLIAYASFGEQFSNPEGDGDIFLINVSGFGKQNLTNTSGGIDDFLPDFSPSGKKIAYGSDGVQVANPEGDDEVYVMNADGTNRKNLTNTADGIHDAAPDYAPDGKKIAYESDGTRSSNPEGDTEIYQMNDDGSKQRNLSNTGSSVDDSNPDYAPDGGKITYDSSGAQSSNTGGDDEIYVMKSDGSNQRNITNTGSAFDDIQPDFAKVKEE